jgi:hypothetical protein
MFFSDLLYSKLNFERCIFLIIFIFGDFPFFFEDISEVERLEIEKKF